MSTLLMICAALVLFDRLATIGAVGRLVKVTPEMAVTYTITGAVMVVVLVLAAFKGVTP